MIIRRATPKDAAVIAAIIVPVIRDGTTYTFDPTTSEADALSYWLGPDKETFFAEEGGGLVGTYYIRANQAGGGQHVCNSGYMTNPAFAWPGIRANARMRSSVRTSAARYRAMQFNFVAGSNVRAVRLWQSLGFDIVGRLPHAFKHPEQGYVDAFVMYRSLVE